MSRIMIDSYRQAINLGRKAETIESTTVDPESLRSAAGLREEASKTFRKVALEVDVTIFSGSVSDDLYFRRINLARQLRERAELEATYVKIDIYNADEVAELGTAWFAPKSPQVHKLP